MSISTFIFLIPASFLLKIKTNPVDYITQHKNQPNALFLANFAHISGCLYSGVETSEKAIMISSFYFGFELILACMFVYVYVSSMKSMSNNIRKYNISRKTAQMQRTMFNAIVGQILFAVMVYILPINAMLVTMSDIFTYSISISMFMQLIMLSYAPICSLCMILLVTHFRNEILGWFPRFGRERRERSTTAMTTFTVTRFATV
ncbi:serpentine type 7TM GPCR chemoreceptor srh domain-containing protein [Ditylenchus destructor]|uniref:Serpentine type 7TM GPCR chemoreceptor srh domain-containing protein n=1 Tax=Ditylenchus destructor TaxID=166010 RepID=A0AAD4N855_9BILA|nr:serpentine type 7TM GPCR chemoreceptor srh domain-containing protein [Ditylenchus destructor]